MLFSLIDGNWLAKLIARPDEDAHLQFVIERSRRAKDGFADCSAALSALWAAEFRAADNDRRSPPVIADREHICSWAAADCPGGTACRRGWRDESTRRSRCSRQSARALHLDFTHGDESDAPLAPACPVPPSALRSAVTCCRSIDQAAGRAPSAHSESRLNMRRGCPWKLAKQSTLRTTI